jgi:hypothetical protein
MKTFYRHSNVAGIRMLSLYNTDKLNTFGRTMVAAFLVDSVPEALTSLARLLKFLQVTHTLRYHKAMR